MWGKRQSEGSRNAPLQQRNQKMGKSGHNRLFRTLEMNRRLEVFVKEKWLSETTSRDVPHVPALSVVGQISSRPQLCTGKCEASSV